MVEKDLFGGKTVGEKNLGFQALFMKGNWKKASRTVIIFGYDLSGKMDLNQFFESNLNQLK